MGLIKYIAALGEEGPTGEFSLYTTGGTARELLRTPRDQLASETVCAKDTCTPCEVDRKRGAIILDRYGRRSGALPPVS